VKPLYKSFEVTIYLNVDKKNVGNYHCPKEILHFLYHPQSLATSLIDDAMQMMKHDSNLSQNNHMKISMALY
jgi:hypothetical protein